jgi:hypothetical protein
MNEAETWPALPAAAWADTRETLHLWTQVIGKVRLALTPWLNHSWHVPLYVTVRGLTTSLMPANGSHLQIDFDFIDHLLLLRMSDGQDRQVKLRPMAVAEFYGETFAALKELGVEVSIDTIPNEISDAAPFEKDFAHEAYDEIYANNFWRTILSAHEVLAHFRTGFIGKASPVHFFWGSFDLAVTRFSGRRAPLHPGGVPNLPDEVTREAYSHEVSSAGFWPGGGGPVEEAAFYSYAYPAPEGFADARIAPPEARWSSELSEFLLPYEAVRTASDSKAALMAFLQSTYDAAANLGHWDRAALDCPLGEPGIVRPI